MRQIHDQQYTQFTSMERLKLTVAALARGDEVEADRLWQTCPRYQYRAYDCNYTSGFNTFMILNSMFFEKCVRHYNNVKKLDELILQDKQDLSGDQITNFIEIMNKPKESHISKLKGLFAGFKLFCEEANLDYENAITIIAIKQCCHDIEVLLASNVSIDMEYADQIKDFFISHWDV